MHGLSESKDWKVNGDDDYHKKILQCGNEEKNLRIADLREKVHHERMLKLLEMKIKKKFPNECKHWNKDEEYKDKKKTEYNTGVIFYETSFSRSWGITQVVIIINEDYRLMIQLQNDQFRRCLILHQKNKESDQGLENRLERIKNGVYKCLWEKFGENIEKFNSFGKYFKYKYDKIEEKETVNDILDKVVRDIENIMCEKKFKNLAMYR